MSKHASDLVQRCLAGDQRAWSALIDTYAGVVYAVARAHRLDEATADDVAQTVFARLARSLPTLEEPQALAGWLATTARRECWRLLRIDQRDRKAVRHAPTEAELDDAMRSIESAARVREALVELGGRCQELLTALFLSASPPDYEAISRSLGLPVGSIGPTRARCLAKLARILREDS